MSNPLEQIDSLNEQIKELDRIIYESGSNNKPLEERLIDLAEILERQRDELLNTVKPSDVYPEFTIIRFTKPGRFYGSSTDKLTYAAIKADGYWFLTGLEQFRKSWDDLLMFIGAENWSTMEVASFTSDLSPAVARLVNAHRRWFRLDERGDLHHADIAERWSVADWRVVAGTKEIAACDIFDAVAEIRRRAASNV